MLKNKAKRKLVLISILMSLAILISGCNLIQMKPEANKKQVVGEIEDHKITKEDFNYYLFVEKLSWELQGQKLPTEGEQFDQIKSQILDKLVNDEMTLYLAKKEEIEVDEGIVDEQVEEMKGLLANDLGGEKEYEDKLKENDLTSEGFEGFLKNYFLINQYVEGLGEKITKDVTISDKEVKEYYEENKLQFDPSTAKAKHILVDKENEKLAKEISKRGKDGEDFDKLIEEYNGKEDILEAADLGQFNKTKMVTDFSEGAFALEPGEVSDIVKSDFGLHIIKLEEKDEKPVKEFDEVKEDLKNQLEIYKKQEEFSKYLENKQKELNIKKHPKKL